MLYFVERMQISSGLVLHVLFLYYTHYKPGTNGNVMPKEYNAIVHWTCIHILICFSTKSDKYHAPVYNFCPIQVISVFGYGFTQNSHLDIFRRMFWVQLFDFYTVFYAEQCEQIDSTPEK